LEALRAHGYHITIASHRSPEHTAPTEKWLQRHGLVYDELHLSHKKTDIYSSSTDVVVDDIPQFLERAVECGAKAVGLMFPWNEAYRRNGFRFYPSLDEVLAYILQT
jgi:hypothetical protein